MKLQRITLYLTFFLQVLSYTGEGLEAQVLRKVPDRKKAIEVKDFVNRAVRFYRKKGAEEAFRAFSDPASEFSKGDAYIFVNEISSGKVVAHGCPSQNLIGENWSLLLDGEGKPMEKKMMDYLNAYPAVWVRYCWTSPSSGTLQSKIAYVVKVGDYAIGSGYYDPTTLCQEKNSKKA